ncbi:MAG: DUF4384 domain-containing protein [Elusimicrobia bacterium]|nr:DUF4384 domain-containing protein [Elusimicrobiota bacterium]
MTRRTALALAMLAATAAPIRAKDNAGIKSLDKALKKPSAVLVEKLKGKVCVMDFSDLSQAGYTSEFGQKVADLLSNRLVNHGKDGFAVMERRELVKILHDSILMVGDDAQAMQDLQKQGGMDILVSGTYSVAEPEVSIDIKAVDARTGALLASATTRLKEAEGLKSMLSHRFKEFGPAEPETAAKQKGEPPSQDQSRRSVKGDEGHPAVDILELETGVFYEGGDGKLYPLREGMVMNSKDNYAIYLRPKQPCYVYIYQVDSSQKAFKLFPSADLETAQNPVSPREYWVPNDKEFLFLDENHGREQIYIFATRAPAAGLDGIQEIKLPDIQQAIRTMGVAGKRGSEVVTKAKGTQGNAVDLIARKLSAQGDFFYNLSFIHQ